jgi:hypothetical protein
MFWIDHAEQKALLRTIAAGGPEHFALTLTDFDLPALGRLRTPQADHPLPRDVEKATGHPPDQEHEQRVVEGEHRCVCEELRERTEFPFKQERRSRKPRLTSPVRI